MWCRPEPSSVSPMYMPGRLRTASRPFSTLMEPAPYSSAPSAVFRSVISVRKAQATRLDADALGATFQVFEKRFVGARQEGLQAERGDFVKERRSPGRIQVGGDLIQQQYRIRLGFSTRKSRALGQNQIEDQ